MKTQRVCYRQSGKFAAIFQKTHLAFLQAVLIAVATVQGGTKITDPDSKISFIAGEIDLTSSNGETKSQLATAEPEATLLQALHGSRPEAKRPRAPWPPQALHRP